MLRIEESPPPHVDGYEREVQGEEKMVGAVRFELTTSCTRNKRASQATLRPDKGGENADWTVQLQPRS